MKASSHSRNRTGPTLRRAGFALALASAFVLGQSAAWAEDPMAAAMPGKPDFPYGTYDLGTQGYVMKEFSVSGMAVSYGPAGKAGAGGIVPAKPEGSAAYKTRVVVITPADPAKFNGTVVVEWLNVSGGLDVPVDFIMLHRELLRGGYAYVGVSAQQVGVDGGPRSISGNADPLKKADPARYGTLVHPGDAYSFDIFSDAARLLKSQPATLLGPLKPKRILAVGQSQSAIYLATYVNEVDPLVRVYDGFLLHSRAGYAAPLDGTSMYHESLAQLQTPTKLNPNPRVPVLQLATETDLIGLGAVAGLYPVQQPDSPHLRTWEIAGAAHVDNYELGTGMIDIPQLPVAKLAAAWAPKTSVLGITLPVPVNNGPQHHYVAEAALVRLDEWVAGGQAPPAAGRITLQLDTKGGLAGGIRTPWVDVPVSHLTGFPAGVLGSAAIAGAAIPYDQAALAQFYPGGKTEYLRKFRAALDKTIQSGFILPADREEILDLARLSYPPGAPPAASP